jgi:hypothetical protein
MHALGDLLGNPFAPAIIDKIEVQARVDYRNDGAEIVGLALGSDQVRAGTRLPLRVTLRPYDGAEVVETVTVDVPRSLAGKTMKIEAGTGAKVLPERPRPESLADVVANLRLYYPASSLVVSLTTRDDGASLHGQLLGALPPSALDTVRSSNQTRRATPFQVVERTAFPRGRILSGRQEITVRVRGPEKD